MKSYKKPVQMMVTAILFANLSINAQWNPTDPPATWNINASRTGVTKIGPAVGVPVPATNQFEVETPGGNDGIHVLDVSGGDPILRLHNGNGAGADWWFQSFQAPSRLQIYDGGGGAGLFTIETLNGNCGVGTTAPTYRWQVETPTAGDGVLVRNTGGDAPVFFDNASASVWGIHNAPTSAFQVEENGNIKLHIDAGTAGNVGVGTTSPGSKLEASFTTAGTDGIRVKQVGAGDAAIFVDNSPTGGSWSLKTRGTASGPTPDFIIRDEALGADRMFIAGTAAGQGNVGIGTNAPAGKLNVVVNLGAATRAGQFDYTSTSTGTALIANAAATGAGITVHGLSGNSNVTGASRSIGVLGTAAGIGATTVFGGRFIANGGASVQNFGVYGQNNSSAAALNVGVYGDEGFAGANNYAAYFVGKTQINGVTTINGNTTINGSLFVSSDKKFKKNIRNIDNSADRLSRLNPSQYEYRSDEIKGLSLPAGVQFGLIAQEVEAVFPELVMTVEAHNSIDREGNIVEVPSYKTVNYIGLIPVLLSAFKEQQSKIADLEAASKAGLSLGLDGNLSGVSSTMNMETNVPNPFSHETVIGFTLPADITAAYLGVYDLSGKQVKTITIVDRGSSQIKLSADNLASGMYIYSIIADNKVVATKKMIVSDK